MNLKTLCRELGEYARSMALINHSSAGASLGELNPLSVEWYPMLHIIPAGTHVARENTTRFGLAIYYLDRLLEDNSNAVDIFSSSVENLKNLLVAAKSMPGVVAVQEQYTIRNFMPEKMDDRLAGAYAEVWVEVMNDTLCEDPEVGE